ncbi:hypothetical protein Ancab_019247 [Ancistrocladus abbreviatus]
MNVLVNPTPTVSRPTGGTAIANGRKLVPFKESSCRFEGASRVSNLDDVEVSKPLVWEGQPARSASFSLPGPERPQGRPSSSAQGVFVGPGTRPDLLQNTIEIQREETSVSSLSPGSPQLQTDRGKSKRTKKSLMDDILQMHLSKRVIGKGHLRQRIGRQ